MSPIPSTVWEPSETFLIQERLTPSPIGLPGLPGNIPIGPSLTKLQRMVFQIRAEADIHFGGKKLDRQPGLYEWFIEAITPGDQITTKRTGRQSFIMMYYGCLNIVGAPGFADKTVDLNWIAYYGTDPIPSVHLYRNKRITFSSEGGLSDPTALAFYNSRTGELKEIGVANRAALIEQALGPGHLRQELTPAGR